MSCTLRELVLYFLRLGTLGFGGPIALASAMQRDLVQQRRWLSKQDYSEGLALAQLAPGPLAAQQFLDAVAVAMITPGPVVITVAFIGYLVAGGAGAVVAALGTFVPCYLFTVIPAPYFRRFAKNAQVKSFVDGVTAAATGAIAGAAFVLARRALIDGPTLLVALATLAALVRFKKLQEPIVILVAGTVGMALHALR